MLEEDYRLFNDSLDRCRRRSDFLSRFYELFIASSPEVAQKFSHTDFDKQRKVLARSFYAMMMFSQRQHDNSILEDLGQLHSRAGRNIRPAMYDLWLSCLLVAVHECDPLWTPRTERAWRATMEPGIAFLKSMY
jgi:hemoglobin-like flavoprotein